MKNLVSKVHFAIYILLCTVIFSASAAGQTRLNEKQVMKKKHIDFSKEVIYFELSGKIEIDGHTFINDTCKSPIIYTSNLEGISIFDKDTKVKYTVRKCERKGCKTTHLIKETNIQDYITIPQWQGGTWLNDPSNIYLH